MESLFTVGACRLTVNRRQILETAVFSFRLAEFCRKAVSKCGKYKKSPYSSFSFLVCGHQLIDGIDLSGLDRVLCIQAAFLLRTNTSTKFHTSARNIYKNWKR